MAARFVNIDYDTPLFLAPNLRDWVPAGHLAHFILEAVAEMDLRQVHVHERGSGCPQYPPRMLLALLLYCYATGLFSSRRIARATHDSVPVRLMCGGTHSDHDTICAFRRENKALLQETFVRMLELAQELKFLQVGPLTLAVDGTKVLANASKHAAVSYEHAGKTIQQWDWEVKELLAKAEPADSTPLEDGLTVPPEEIQRRQERKAKLAAARVEIQARAQARAAAERAAYKAKLEERAAQKDQGKKPRGPEPKEPSQQPKPGDQYNVTDPESRLMQAGSGPHFEQSHNAPAAVQAVEQNAAGQPTGTPVYAAVEKKEHHRTVRDLERRDDPVAPAAGASAGEIMKHRLPTAAGKAKYKLRQQTVKPVFGIIQSVLGFRQFLLRGKEKVGLEWKWACLAYNFKRLHRMAQSFPAAG